MTCRDHAYVTDHSPGGGGLLSIMPAPLKTGGPSNTEKRKIGGPGVYGDLWDIRRKMKYPIRREMKTAGKTPVRIIKHSNCSEIPCFSAVSGVFEFLITCREAAGRSPCGQQGLVQGRSRRP